VSPSRQSQRQKSQRRVTAPESAGESSTHLDDRQQRQAAAHSAPAAIVLHEVVREEGEAELKRPTGALLWSGVAAGLSMGFSLLCLATLKAMLPVAPWADIIAAPGYCVGFIIVILGRQQLFTESTLTGMLPLFVHPNLKTLLAVGRLWLVVLVANLAGTTVIARLLAIPHVFDPPVYAAMHNLGSSIVHTDFGPTFLKAVFSGWLIGLMVWVLPSARSARLFVILVLTYVVAIGHLPHVVAGSVEAAYAYFSGAASLGDYFSGFLAPTLLGNVVGGVALAGLLNHAPLAEDFSGGSRP
jgi:formate-nitrite transporter family protein